MSQTQQQFFTDRDIYSLTPTILTQMGLEKLIIVDHLGGFSESLDNDILSYISSITDSVIPLCTSYIPTESLTEKYTKLDLHYAELQVAVLEVFGDYRFTNSLEYKNFICSFNGSPHVGRQLLVSILHYYKFFNNDFCSKNFSSTPDQIDGHINMFCGINERFYRKFFITDDVTFYSNINGFEYDRCDHFQNIIKLEKKLKQSFVHVVSETMATSYLPFVTEKFLYSVITKGLFVAYAQPGWHAHLEKYFGFKKYEKIFDYSFDSIKNPVERLVEMITMLAKFANMSVDDWHDLYRLEQDTIDFNYHHYYNKDYIKQLKEYY